MIWNIIKDNMESIVCMRFKSVISTIKLFMEEGGPLVLDRAKIIKEAKDETYNQNISNFYQH